MNSKEGGPGKTTPVGQYSPAGDSPCGVADMAGNVWEWCSTIWDEKAYPFKVQDEWMDEYLKRTNAPRVLRGGSWYFGPQLTRCACRLWSVPVSCDDSGGFRVLVSPSF